MAKEQIYNIFVYFDGGTATEYGACYHELSGSDEEKSAYLISQVDHDHVTAERFRFPRSFTCQEWLAVFRYGNELEYFEEAFKLFGASGTSLFCITSIVDGTPTVEMRIGPDPFRGDVVTRQEGWGAMPDYLVHYTSGNAFRFIELINDDYFKAIRTLFNAKFYVSSSKLLMSCVDTLAYVEYGDVQGNFSKWIETYVDLTPLGISADELWEFRNSVLHMTNLASRKVLAGKVSPIMPCVGGPPSIPPIASDDPKRFNLLALIKAIGEGIGKWGEAYNADPSRMLKFIERYDTTISDSRWASIPKPYLDL
jgi:hypothetical protein